MGLVLHCGVLQDEHFHDVVRVLPIGLLVWHVHKDLQLWWQIILEAHVKDGTLVQAYKWPAIAGLACGVKPELFVKHDLYAVSNHWFHQVSLIAGAEEQVALLCPRFWVCASADDGTIDVALGVLV